MRAELARRGRSGGSRGPGPAVGATFGEEESGRRRSRDHRVLGEACPGGAAQRSLGMAEAAAESMAVVVAGDAKREEGFGFGPEAIDLV